MFLATAALILSLTAIPTRALQTRAGTSVVPTGPVVTPKRAGGSAGATAKRRAATATTPVPSPGDGSAQQAGGGERRTPLRRGRPPKTPRQELSVGAGAASVSPGRVEENRDPQQDHEPDARESSQETRRTLPRAGSPPPGTPLVLRERGPDEEDSQPIDAGDNEAGDAPGGGLDATMSADAADAAGGDTAPGANDEEGDGGALPSTSEAPADDTPADDTAGAGDEEMQEGGSESPSRQASRDGAVTNPCYPETLNPRPLTSLSCARKNHPHASSTAPCPPAAITPLPTVP